MSKIKLGNKHFFRPGDVTRYFNLYLGATFEIEDAKRKGWQNDNRTLVIRASLPIDDMHFEDGLALGKLCEKYLADEFSRMNENGFEYFKLTWNTRR